ncbi:MAG: DNA topoisomerase 3, partial [Selenomonadales bacterium]|nr:DNA topoisomerase 3 [Selenomonadales bacterium]
MGKRVVLAEKPSVARDLARVLGCGKDSGGFFEGKEDIVTWALGHLVTLADPEVYDDSYKVWRIEDLPMLPPAMKLVTIKGTTKQFQTVKKLLSRDDVSEVVIATDAGREGELVARWILVKANCKKPIKRLWISSVTDKAIREGFARLADGKAYDTLYLAASARAEADWLVGINATRALTCKHNAQLSCGRVQTPTLAMIAARQDEIQNFTAKPYYGLAMRCKGYRLTWFDGKTNQTRIQSRERCEDILKRIAGERVVVREVTKKAKQKQSPQLYDLTELQRDANKLYGYSAKETLSLMQKLYESHKILTYPRTDSRYLSADIVQTIPERLKACGIGSFSKPAFQILKRPIAVNKNYVDDTKVSDHHAIIPTEQFVNLAKLTDREQKIYELVVRRFLAVLCPPMTYDEVTVVAECGGERFRASGKHITSLGWRELYTKIDEDDGEEDEQSLPSLTEGDVLDGTAVLTEGKTKPPAYFTEATLLSAMEHPAKYM